MCLSVNDARHHVMGKKLLSGDCLLRAGLCYVAPSSESLEAAASHDATKGSDHLIAVI